MSTSTELISRAQSAGLSVLANGNALLDAANKEGVSNGALLRHSGITGQWMFKGQPVDVGATFIFDVWKVRAQWMAWKANKPIEQHNATITNGEHLPELVDLPDHWGGNPQNSDGWVKNLVFDIVDADTGEVGECSLKGDQPWRPAWKLVKEFGEKVKVHLDDQGAPMLAIVEIGDSTFKAKSGQMLHSPTLKLVDWITQAEVDEITVASEGEDASDEAPEEVPLPETKVTARPAAAVRTGRRV